MKKPFVVIMSSALLFALLFWLADSVYEYFMFESNLEFMLFQEPLSFWDSFAADIPPHALFNRLFFLLACLAGGGVTTFLVARWYRSEHRFRTYVAAAPTGVCIADEKGRFVEVNPAACEQTGYSAEELKKMSVDDLLAEEALETGREHFGRAVREGRARGEMLFRKKNGLPLFMTVDAVRLSPSRYLAIAVDTTERKRNEERILHLNDILRTIRDINQVIVWEKERGRVIHETCEILARKRGFHGAWIVLTDELPEKTSAAASGAGKDALPKVRDLFQAGKAPRCLEGGKPVAVPAPCDRCSFAPACRDASAITSALVHGGRRYGALWIYADPAMASDSEELSLVREIAGDIAFALYSDEADKKLRESDKVFRLVADNTVDCIWMTDMDFVFTYVNPAISGMTGYTVDEWIGSRLGDHCDEENFRIVSEAVSQSLRKLPDNSGFSLEAAMLKKDRRPFHVEITGRVLLDREGKPAGLQGVTRDATERKAAEEILRHAEAQQRKVLDAQSQIVLLLDSHCRVTWANRAAYVFSGLRRESMQGMLCHEVLRKDGDGPCADCPVEKALKSGSVRSGIMETGEGKVWRVTGCPVRDPDGRIGGVVEVAEDVSERFFLEEQLRQAQRMESVGRLAGGVAHDFNNLLSIVNGYCDLILDSLDKGDPLRSEVGEIRKAGERATSLTRQLLAFSRKQVLKPRPLCLNTILEQMEKMLKRLIGEDIELSMARAADLRAVEADPGQMEQIVMNLAVNARDAMPTGGKLIIETRNAEIDETDGTMGPGPYALLSMSDTGHGMEPAVLNRIFEPFYTTKERGKGTGLGLSTVFGIVKQSGGDIRACSEKGKGSTFEIFLPETKKEPEGFVPRKASKAGGTETLLIVEDESAVRELARRILESAGYKTLEAANGGEALLLCERFGSGIALVLTDIVMPGMSGKELYERLSRINPAMKVVYMSGYTDNAIVHHGILDRETHFINKPFTVNDLLSKIRIALDENER